MYRSNERHRGLHFLLKLQLLELARLLLRRTSFRTSAMASGVATGFFCKRRLKELRTRYTTAP
jgi:hypothetical protein